MRDPVVLADGHSYERSYIERWLARSCTSPVSGAPLPQKDVFPNHALRNAIEEYFAQVFSVHRRAIRKSIAGPAMQEGLGSNATLLRTIDGLMQCSLLVNADLSTERILQQIMDEAKAIVGAEVASVFLVDAPRQELRSSVNSTGSEIRVPVGSGIVGHVAARGEAVIIPDAYTDPRFNKAVDRETGFRTRSILCAPLRTRKGSVMGVVELINKTSDGALRSDGLEAEGPECFTVDDVQFVQVFASQAALAIASSEDQAEPALQARLAGPPRGGAGPSVPAAAFEPPRRQVASAAPGPPAGAGEAEKALGPLAGEGEAEEAEAEGGLGRLLAVAAASWRFDALELAKRTGNKPLSTLGVHLFDKCQLVERCGLDRSKVVRFLTELERGYDDAHRYHNRSHAASVLHAMHALLDLGGLAEVAARAFWGEGSLERGVPLVTLACLLAAAAHDYEHRGLNNDFLTKTQDQRAVRYNDKNVNEAHHVAAAFALMRQPGLDFLAELPQEDFRWLRGLCIDLVIATDMANNNAILSSFTAALDASLAPAAAGCAEEALRDAAADRAGFRPAGAQDAVLLLQMAIKCADLGHLALPWDTHVEWLRRLESEFFAQGDLEVSLGMPPSFLMDRTKPGASKTQEGFMKSVALPLFSALERAAPSARPMLDSVVRNYERWLDRAACLGPGDSSASTQSPAAHDVLEFCCVDQALTEEPGSPSCVSRVVSKDSDPSAGSQPTSLGRSRSGQSTQPARRGDPAAKGRTGAR